MKKIIIITLVVYAGLITSTYGQSQLDVPIEIGKWQDEKDTNSFWEFKMDGKLYSSYQGRSVVFIYNYTISSTPPVCPDAQLSEEPNVKYLRLVNEKDGDISCFYIYALNDKRLTVMDAVTGHIFPSVRVEE